MCVCLQVLFNRLADVEVWKTELPTFRVTFDETNHAPLSLAVSPALLDLFCVTFTGFTHLVQRQSALRCVGRWCFPADLCLTLRGAHGFLSQLRAPRLRADARRSIW